MRLDGEPSWVTGRKAGADEPYEGILHVRVCGGRRGQPRPLPGSECGRAALVSEMDALGRPHRSVLALQRMSYAPLLIAVALLWGCATPSKGPSFSELPESKPVDPYDALRARHLVPGDRFPMVIGLGPNPPVVVDLTDDRAGYVELPQIGKLHVAGMLGTEMEKAVAGEYRKRGIPLHGMVHPGVVE